MPEDFEAHKKIIVIPHFRIVSLIVLTTVLSWSGWALVVTKLDPYQSTKLGLPLFFISSFIAFAGSFTLLLFFLKKWRTKDQVYIKHILISLRQGILLSSCTCLALALQMLGLLRIWNGLLLVVLMMLIEFYFSGKDEL